MSRPDRIVHKDKANGTEQQKAVIPGRRKAASPEAITTAGDYGFRAPSLR